MPQAAQQHRQQQIAIGLEFPVTIAAEWDIQIIAKPGTQTDVPTPPEVSIASSRIRKRKVSMDKCVPSLVGTIQETT
jgi:hypothetical protein